jgi:hypothetical protein
MLEGNTLHHRPGSYVVSSHDPTRRALMRVISHTLDGRVRCAYLDPKRQKIHGPPDTSNLLIDPRILYPPGTFEIAVPELEEIAEWTVLSQR